MVSFGSRVRYIGNEFPLLLGKNGAVTRLCTTGYLWVRFDEEIPDDIRMFPSMRFDKSEIRRNDMQVHPDEVEEP